MGMNILLKESSAAANHFYQQDQKDLLPHANVLEKIKPFISLKLYTAKSILEGNHPHLIPASGKAIITYVVSGEVSYSDSTGKRGTLKKDDWSWIITGSGMYYSFEPMTGDYAAIQLCVALSPALES